MTQVTQMTQHAPQPPRSRLYAIDLLRGVAVLGILLMNIQSFSMPVSAYTYPWSWGDMNGINAAVYYLCHVLADGKFITIFALLFGAGVILQSQKPSDGQSAPSAPQSQLHYRRMFGLLAFGLFHAYFIWYGDILFSYALLGMLIFLLRNVPIRVQVMLAAVLFIGGVAFNVAMGLGMKWIDSAYDAQIAAQFNPSPEQQLQEVNAYRGGLVEQLNERFPVTLISQTYILLTYCLPLVTALMLAGMALLRSGFFHFAWKRDAYLRLALCGPLLGYAFSLVGIWLDARTGRDPILSTSVIRYLNVIGTVPAALGYAAAILLIAHSKIGHRLWPLAAVGRTALSCYLLQSILCTLIFYGHGLGLFGKVERIGQLGIAVGVWVVLIVFASVWTSRFRFGPAEWIWRRLTYGAASLKAATPSP